MPITLNFSPTLMKPLNPFRTDAWPILVTKLRGFFKNAFLSSGNGLIVEIRESFKQTSHYFPFLVSNRIVRGHRRAVFLSIHRSYWILWTTRFPKIFGHVFTLLQIMP